MDSARLRAAKNLDRALDVSRRFPSNVFRGEWSAYLFFDLDLIFVPAFPETIQRLLAWEEATCICMRNLDPAGAESSADVFWDGTVNGEMYVNYLAGPASGTGWLYQMGRFALTSDVGGWCIYCERNNEIAVLAVRHIKSSVQFTSATQALNPVPIDQAIAKPPSYGLSPPGLPAKWRQTLLKEYRLTGSGVDIRR